MDAGATSVMNSESPRATGMAMITATTAMRMVSTMMPAIPKWWMSGCQAWVVRKENLDTRSAGSARTARKTPTRAKMARTTTALPRFSPRKARSAGALVSTS